MSSSGLSWIVMCSLKSDHFGIEMAFSIAGRQRGFELKSDHFGIEITLSLLSHLR